MAKKEKKSKILHINEAADMKREGGLWLWLDDQDIKEWAKDREKFRERGKAGKEERRARQKARDKQKTADKELVRQYGIDAPKARTFRTPKPRPMSEAAYKKKNKPKAKPKRKRSSDLLDYRALHDERKKGRVFAEGGSVKKYAKGGGVRKSKR